ncbi:unnamed protein product [Microthlaspi erraticum]|uniref:SHSP domain-containing protein n=1 Tax=Microthlaspi erraticum TaxID=1685480 RepID=A0A6D2HZS7_9BRAS|nr:unnamed protein product [Microthlaspi erraticum]CAA7022674.1 unnamed protein product [Microthlaspi erraticum]
MDSNNPENKSNQTILNVVPLNSAPYVGPSSSYTSSMLANKSNDNAEKARSPMILLPSGSIQEVYDLLSQNKNGVVLTGSAALGKIGHTVGLVDIAVSDETYFFRVSLPGVVREEKYFSCEISDDGTVSIKGVTATGEKTVCKHSQVFKMLTQNMSPPGHFSISFPLPGPVKSKEVTGNFGPDGVLECVVKKKLNKD